MGRLDYYKWPGAQDRGFVIDVQTDLLDSLRTRIVVPLLPLAVTPTPVRELNPVFDLGGQPHVLVTQSLASIPCRDLCRVAGTPRDRHDVITRALDLLLAGF